MLLNETLPNQVKHAIRENIGDTEIEISISSDIDSAGQFGEQWLVLADKNVMVFSMNSRDAILSKKLALGDIKTVKAESLVGNSALEATTTGGDLVELLRYSYTHSAKFAAAAKWLDQLANGKQPAPVTEEGPVRCPKCNMLLTKDSKVCPRCIQRRKVILRLLGYLNPYRFIALAIVVIMLSGTGISLVPPYLTKILVDRVLNSVRYDLLGWIILAFLGMRLLSEGLHILVGRLTAALGSRITYDIRGQLYEKIQSMSLSFFDKHKTGELMSRINRDTQELQELIAFQISFFSVNLLLLIGVGSVLLWMNWQLALLTLIPAPLVALVTVSISRRIRSISRRVWHRWSQLSAVLNDTLSGIRVVKGFAQEPRESNRFDAKSFSLFQATKHAVQLWATFMPVFSFLWGSGTIIVWYFGGRNVMGGDMTLGTLMAFLAYLGMFYGPLNVVSRIWNWITRALAAAERIFEILDMQPEVPDELKTVPMPKIKGAVEFRNVTFGYSSHEPVLFNIDLKVKPGEMLGFVGRSGAGKTTMTNLICRFYKADEGEILIDGVDIKQLELADLRRQIGIVLQDPFLFNGTIAENIGYARPGATHEEIMQAAKIANAHDFIVKFRDGYDTIVGERGQRLSGGERQRVSIARAVLRDPRILILDEATSLVDTQTEKNIQEALARLVKGRTTFAIAHRLSTLRNADRLMVLDKGKLAEMGTHDELMQTKGTYSKLVELQREMSKIKALDG